MFVFAGVCLGLMPLACQMSGRKDTSVVTPSVAAEILVPPGRYSFEIPASAKFKLSEGSMSFDWSGTSPAPLPGPQPGPQPPQPPPPGPVPPSPQPPVPPAPPPAPAPAPVVGKLWVIAVYDYDALTLLPRGQSELRVSTTIHAALAALNASWKVYNLRDPYLSKYIANNVIPSAPFVFVTDEKGKTYPPFSITNEADVVAVVSAIRQKGASK